jgi:prepilin-type N-terminal cleavage/methylation domain-containing protein
MGSAAGFTLVETLVALALVSIALFMGLALAWQQPRIHARLAAQQEALRLLEATLEGLRAGAVPLHSGALPPPWIPSGISDLLLRLEVEAVEPAGLYRVEAVAYYRVAGGTEQSRVETLVWRRP